jgi:glycosyltransferase involved in cell wall biosynthesis
MNKTVVTYVGRLELDKSPMRLVKIAKRLYDEKLPVVVVVVGDGSQMTNLKNQALRHGIVGKTIEFVGYSNNPIRAMQLSDYTLLVSNMEGLPMSVLESMSVGTPAITSAVGGIPEIITDQKDGFLVNLEQLTEQKIIAEFVRTIDKARNLDKQIMNQMCNAAKEKINLKFSSMTEEYNSLIE